MRLYEKYVKYRKYKELKSRYPKWKILAQSSCTTISMVIKIILADDDYSSYIHNKHRPMLYRLVTQFTEILSRKNDLTLEELKKSEKLLFESARCTWNSHFTIAEDADFLTYHTALEKRSILKLLVSVALVNGYSYEKEALLYEVGQSFDFSKKQIQDLINKVIVESKEKDKTNPLYPYDTLCCQKIGIISMSIKFVNNILSKNA